MKVHNKNLGQNVQKHSRQVKESSKAAKSGADFQSQLKELNQKEIRERFDRLFNIVDEQGKKLKESLDKEDLYEYKRRVKDFLRMIQKEFVQAKQSYSWDAAGNLKTHTIIEEINQNLDVLHEMFFQEQADVLEIVKKIDEIRGLLLDLYI